MHAHAHAHVALTWHHAGFESQKLGGGGGLPEPARVTTARGRPRRCEGAALLVVLLLLRSSSGGCRAAAAVCAICAAACIMPRHGRACVRGVQAARAARQGGCAVDDGDDEGRELVAMRRVRVAHCFDPAGATMIWKAKRTPA